METLLDIKDMIGEGRIKDALDSLKAYLRINIDQQLYDEVIINYSRYNEQMRYVRTGQLENEVEKNRIIASILAIVNQIIEKLPPVEPKIIERKHTPPTPAKPISANHYEEDFKKAQEARKNLDYNTAISILTKYENSLDAKGLGLLGNMYINGDNPHKDFEKGIGYLKNAAKQGDYLGYLCLGVLHFFGQGFPQDSQKAKEYLEKAIECKEEDGEALLYLSKMYYDGVGIKENKKLGVEYLLKAANKNHTNAMSNLANFYYNGLKGIKQSTKEAIKWAKLAAQREDADAKHLLGLIYFDEEKYEWAIPFLLESAENGNSEAQWRIGYIYEEGLDIEEDIEKAIYWYNEAIKQDSTVAANNLGVMYLDGRGVIQNYKKAYNHFKFASDKGMAEAANNLGFLYKNGFGVEKNRELAKHYYEIALQRGYSKAQAAIDELNSFWSIFK